MLRIPHKDKELEINITSLIDVIFILLIFFMVSTQFKKHALPLDLPVSQDSTEQENTAKILAVSKDKMELEGRIVTMENIQEILFMMNQSTPELSLSLECEKTVDFETVVQILTKIQKAGIDRIGIVHETVD